jgi:hypothetical protein
MTHIGRSGRAALSKSPSFLSLVTNAPAARIGPTVCEHDGPISILNISNNLVFTTLGSWAAQDGYCLDLNVFTVMQFSHRNHGSSCEHSNLQKKSSRCRCPPTGAAILRHTSYIARCCDRVS